METNKLDFADNKYYNLLKSIAIGNTKFINANVRFLF